MNTFLDAIENESTKTFTENGDVTFSTSLNANVDMFFMASAMRNRKESDVKHIFAKAMLEDPSIAMANLYYLRDIRNGQGERRVFRIMLKELASTFPQYITNDLLDSIVLYGRYDDLFVLLSSNKDLIINYIKDKLDNNDSLLAKWMPSENTSSVETRARARIIRESLGMTSRDYRKLLSRLRKEQNLIETHLTEKTLNEVNYSHIPSRAMLKYRSAFHRNDGERYTEYLNSVTKGEVKINTNALNPCDIMHKLKVNVGSATGVSRASVEDKNTLNVLWDNLPNYFGDEHENSIVVADTSGSMTANVSNTSSMTCLDVSLSLAMYIAERNKGAFKDSFITFSSKPTLVKLKGDTIDQKLHSFKSIIDSTNLDAVFDLILKSCVDHNVPKEECPTRIYVISDMEFNQAISNPYNNTVVERIRAKYETAGYDMPQLVFWNAQSRHNNVPVRYNESGVGLVSGYSPVVLKYILNKEQITPVSVMMDVLKNYMK